MNLGISPKLATRRLLCFVCAIAGLALALMFVSLPAQPVHAGETGEQAAPAQDKADETPKKAVPEDATEVPIGYIKQRVGRLEPLSRLDEEPENNGITGAEMGLRDNNTTGQFTKQHYTLHVEDVPVDGDALAALDKLVDQGIHFVLVDAPAEVLLNLADAAKDKEVLLFNIRSRDVALRNENCRFNVMHTAPDRNMLADALAQYLIWKQWNRWFLVNGVLPEDVAFADAMKRAAKRFGGKIVAEKEYEETPGARRTDTGQMLVQRQMPVFTQMTTDYDVLIVADENEIFGPYVPYRTWAARPVAGTSGLYASSWHPAHEQWGATQMQNRFQAYANRFMLPLDYQAWVAVRTVGEAATRTNSANYQTIADFIRSEDFNIAAFMGQRLTYRPWDHQLRLPILVTTPHIPVSVSPQEGFLHPKAEVDTLGTDEPETRCNFN